MRYLTVAIKRPRESASEFRARAEREIARLNVEIKHTNINGSIATVGFIPRGK